MSQLLTDMDESLFFYTEAANTCFQMTTPVHSRDINFPAATPPKNVSSHDPFPQHGKQPPTHSQRRTNSPTAASGAGKRSATGSPAAARAALGLVPGLRRAPLASRGAAGRPARRGRLPPRLPEAEGAPTPLGGRGSDGPPPPASASLRPLSRSTPPPGPRRLPAGRGRREAAGASPAQGRGEAASAQPRLLSTGG